MSSTSIRVWKDSPIFPEQYLVSTDGLVKNKKSQRVLKSTTDKSGYLYYVLCRKNVRKTIKAHRLVALTFIPNPENKPAIDHIDGNKTNNLVSNLKWVTNKENTNNPITIKRLLNVCCNRDFKQMGELRNFGRKKTAVYRNGKLIGVFASQQEASKETGVCVGKVSQCVSGKKKSCKGYEFVGVSDAKKE